MVGRWYEFTFPTILGHIWQQHGKLSNNVWRHSISSGKAFGKTFENKAVNSQANATYVTIAHKFLIIGIGDTWDIKRAKTCLRCTLCVLLVPITPIVGVRWYVPQNIHTNTYKNIQKYVSDVPCVYFWCQLHRSLGPDDMCRKTGLAKNSVWSLDRSITKHRAFQTGLFTCYVSIKLQTTFQFFM